MPSATYHHSDTLVGGNERARNQLQAPLKYQGSLDAFEYEDLTTAIGRQYSELQVKDILAAENKDQLIRDLAVTISQRGVVFLRNQDVTPAQMKELGERLSSLTGAPQSSALHIHPLTEEGSELGDQIQVISSEKQKKAGQRQSPDTSKFASNFWHSDITFEPVPSDYAMLKIHTLPTTGGDTLWASGYSAYEKLSPALATFLEGLTATHDGTRFLEEAQKLGNPIREGQRGSPLNQGSALKAEHPVIRTNPVTGWKSVYVNKVFTKRINGVTKDESDVLINYLTKLIADNHDLQVRFRWKKNDLGIWDNRSNYHTATYDFDEAVEKRAGDRVCSLGEAPYLDLTSKSRKEALGAPA